MQKGRIPAILVVASLLIGALGVQAWSGGRDLSSGQQPVRLKNGTVYMTRAPGTATAQNPTDPAGRSLYLVQFTGPVRPAYKTALTRLGVELGEYMPENAFLVRMRADLRGQVAQLGFVQGVADYLPVHKLDGALAGVGQQATLVRVTTFGAGTKGPVGALAALGARPEAIGAGVMTVRLASSGLQSLAQSSDVVYIEPVRQNQLLQDKAGPLIGVPVAWKNGLDGQGQVVAITDTGLDTGKNDSRLHPDFQGQVKAIYALGKPGDASDTLAHGTHVAGSVLGTGAASDGLFKGMAPGAKLIFQAVEDRQGSLGGIPQDLTQLFRQAYDAGARIHTNSWGVPASSGGSVYDAQAAAVDRFMWENPDYTLLFAAGNDGDHDQDGRANYSTISTPGTAKNAITIGASQNDRPGRKMATNPLEVALFSSRGPTADNRVKPDLVAPGTWIVSTRSSLAADKHFWAPHETNSRYGYMGGTSMATPLTAGAVALLRQYFTDSLKITPRASLLKATLINGAAAMDASATWKDTGWGRVDVSGSLFSTPFRYVNEERALQTEELQTYTYNVNPGKPLKVTLVWTDYPASPAAAKALVNDLDLIVRGPDGRELLGNHMLGATPDRANNVEQVQIAAPVAGSYSVTVRAQNVPQGPQRFALVVSGNVEGVGQPAPPKDPDPRPPQDREPPKAIITSPPNGSTVSGSVTITADATDNVGVTRVVYYVDGREVGSSSTAPHQIRWESTTVADGIRSLVVNAYDAAGNVGISDPVRVTVRNQSGGSGEFQFTGRTGTYGLVRRHYVDVKAGGTVQAELGLTGWASVSLTALDASGKQVASGTNSLRFQAAAAGTYTIVLTSWGGAADYALKLFYPPLEGTRTASQSGSLSAVGQRVAVHTVRLARGGALNAALTVSDRRADLDLYLVDGWGRVMASANSPNLNPETISAWLPAGTYYLYVVADSGRSDYQLTVVQPQ